MEAGVVKRVVRGGGLVVLGVVMMVRGMAAQTVSAVPKLDLKQFSGTWYEVARYPDKREKSCVGDVFSLITPAYKPTQLLLVDSCQTKNGFPHIRNGRAKAQDKSGDGKLKVSYFFPLFWPFLEKRWVLALGPEYEWALVGSPNRKNLWVLSKTRKMTPEVLREVEAKAEAEGFSAGKLTVTPQTAR